MDFNILRIDINRIVATDINLGGILTNTTEQCICEALLKSFQNELGHGHHTDKSTRNEVD